MSMVLPRWARRVVALLLLATVLLVAAWLVVAPVWEMGANYDNRVAELRHQLQRFTRVAAQQERLGSDLRRLQASGAGDRFYLGGSTSALAAAELQRVAKRVVVSSRGEVVSTQVVATDEDGRVQRVVLRVQMRGDISTLQRTFHALETGEPYLFLDNVRIRVWGGSVRRRVNDSVQKLDVAFDLMGFHLVADEPPRSS